MDAGKKKEFAILFYLLIVLLVAAAAVLLYPEYRKKQLVKMELAALENKKSLKVDEITRRQEEINALKNDPAEVEKVAREKFRLCRPGETVMTYPELSGDGDGGERDAD